jgi:hypothetical protein
MYPHKYIQKLEHVIHRNNKNYYVLCNTEFIAHSMFMVSVLHYRTRSKHYELPQIYRKWRLVFFVRVMSSCFLGKIPLFLINLLSQFFCSETLVYVCQNSWHQVPEHNNHRIYRRENPKSKTIFAERFHGITGVTLQFNRQHYKGI